MATTIGASLTARLATVNSNPWRAREAARLIAQGLQAPGGATSTQCLLVNFTGPASRWTLTLTRDDSPASAVIIGQGGTDDREIRLTIPTYSVAVQDTDPMQRNAVSYLVADCTLTLAFASGETASIAVGGDGWTSTP